MLYEIKIKGIDLNALKKQKSALLELQYRMGYGKNFTITKEFEAIQGIINLIDHIQDSAVLQHNLDENEVFNSEENY